MKDTKEKRILNFKDNKIQELTLDELRTTVKEEDYNGKPLMGMYHWDFIGKATDVVSKAGLNFSLGTIFAAQNQDKSRPGVSVIEKYRDEYGENSVQSFLLRRIFADIIITDEEDEFTSTAIALSFNQLGFQLAMGPHVKICRNQCILGAKQFMSTYSSGNKMPGPERMLEVLGDWLHDFREIRQKEIRTIETFRNTMVEHSEVMEIAGDLTAARIRKENSKEFPREPLNPLNQGQIGKFLKSYLLARAQDQERMFSIWDIYNFATELYKPGETDFPLILPSNYSMSQYLMNRYDIN